MENGNYNKVKRTEIIQSFFLYIKEKIVSMKTKFEDFVNESIYKVPQDDTELKVYDINTWKYLMFETDKKLGTILGIESIRTGSALTKKELSDYEQKDYEFYTSRGYKPPKSYSTQPDWYKNMDIRFIVKVKGGGTESWHIKKVLPLTKERFIELGGEEYPKVEYKKRTDF